jgi:hypothetical protein
MLAAARLVALDRQHGHRAGPTFADPADAAGVGDRHVGQEGLVEVRPTGDLADRTDLDPWRRHVEDEEGQPLVLGKAGVGPGQQDGVASSTRPSGR